MESSPYAYFDSIIANRASLLSEEEQLAGATLVSLETGGDEFLKDDVLVLLQENFSNFLRNLRFLSNEDQELLLSYYMVGKTQQTLGWMEGMTQTVISSVIRRAMKRLMLFMTQGEPTVGFLSAVLTKAGMENIEMVYKHSRGKPIKRSVHLSQIVMDYGYSRSFAWVAGKHNVHRPEVRRALNHAYQTLLERNDAREQMVGAHIHGLVNRASAQEQGLSKRKKARQAHIYRADSAILGEFRIDIAGKHSEQLFVSRAVQ